MSVYFLGLIDYIYKKIQAKQKKNYGQCALAQGAKMKMIKMMVRDDFFAFICVQPVVLSQI